MPRAPESWTASEIDVHRIEYFRAVADFAERSPAVQTSALCASAPVTCRLPFLRSWFRRFHHRS